MPPCSCIHPLPADPCGLSLEPMLVSAQAASPPICTGGRRKNKKKEAWQKATETTEKAGTTPSPASVAWPPAGNCLSQVHVQQMMSSCSTTHVLPDPLFAHLQRRNNKENETQQTLSPLATPLVAWVNFIWEVHEQPCRRCACAAPVLPAERQMCA